MGGRGDGGEGVGVRAGRSRDNFASGPPLKKFLVPPLQKTATNCSIFKINFIESHESDLS